MKVRAESEIVTCEGATSRALYRPRERERERKREREKERERE